MDGSMEEQYGIVDLRHYLSGRPHFPITTILPPPPPQNYEETMMMVMGDGVGVDQVGGGTGRWPRQETLTLLEIRSRLHPNFKHSLHKGPLWDQVSRIMCEEHGYQRSGKKCREKFENLYKYYKKTKEGKAGRQDGKNYRFFRQLEALCAHETNTNTNTDHPPHPVGTTSLQSHNAAAININTAQPNHQELTSFQAPKLSESSLSLNNTSSEFDSSSSTSSSDNNNDDSGEKIRKKRRGVRARVSWKAKVREFIDGEVRKLMEKQEEWLEKTVRTLERKEQERISREEEWRRQEADRIEREHKFWANERAWIEARDAVLMKALQKFTSGELTRTSSSSSPQQQQQYLMIRKEMNQTSSCFFQNSDLLYNNINNGGDGYGDQIIQQQHGSNTTRPADDDDDSGGAGNNVMQQEETCFRVWMGNNDINGGKSLWENYGVKLNKMDS